MSTKKIKTIGKLSFVDDNMRAACTGTAYFESDSRELFTKIFHGGFEPYTIPRHRLMLELDSSKWLLSEKIYNEIPVFANGTFKTSYPVPTYLEVDSKEEAIELFRDGFDRIYIKIRAKNKYETRFSPEDEKKVTITQEAKVKEIFSEEKEDLTFRVNTAYTLKGGYVLTPGITLRAVFKENVEIEYIENIIQAFYVYYYLYHSEYDLVIDDVFIGVGEKEIKYNIDLLKYTITTPGHNKPLESLFSGGINTDALQKTIMIFLNNQPEGLRLKNALNDFYNIASGAEIELSRGCIAECSVLEKIINKKKIGATRKKTMLQSIEAVQNAIKPLEIDSEVMDFYSSEPRIVLGAINNIPFLKRVELYCSENKIELEQQDKEALKLVYEYRNQLVHGQLELSESEIDEKIKSKNIIEERIEEEQKTFYYKYRAGAFHGVFTLIKEIIKKTLETNN